MQSDECGNNEAQRNSAGGFCLSLRLPGASHPVTPGKESPAFCESFVPELEFSVEVQLQLCTLYVPSVGFNPWIHQS